MSYNPSDATDSPELNVDSAVSAFESYLSDEETKDEPQAGAPTELPPAEPVEASDEPADAEDGESEEADEQATESPQAPQTFTVKVNGEDVTVTLEELQKGYSRTQDYTRKTMEVSQARKAFEGEVHAVRQERQMYAAQLTQLEQVLRDATPQEPDWARVQLETPDQFPQLYAQWSAHKERLAAVAQERAMAQQAVLRDQQQLMQRHLEAEYDKVLEALPQWRDPQVAANERAKLVAYTQDLGYAPEEIAQVTDHRVLLILHKAMQWDAAQKNRPAIQQRIEKVKTATPGPASTTRPADSKAQKARQRLAKTGRQEDAAALFETLLPDD